MFSKTLLYFLFSFVILVVAVRVISSTMVIGDDVATAVGGMVVAGATFFSAADVHNVSSNVTSALVGAPNDGFTKSLMFVAPTMVVVVFVFVIANNEGVDAWDNGVLVSLVLETLNRVVGDAGMTNALILVVVVVGIVVVIIVTSENTTGELRFDTSTGTIEFAAILPVFVKV